MSFHKRMALRRPKRQTRREAGAQSLRTCLIRRAGAGLPNGGAAITSPGGPHPLREKGVGHTRGSIALRTLAIALATPLLFVSNLSAEEVSGSRIQAEVLNPTNTTRVYNSIATPDGGSTPNALRHDTNVTVTYPVTVPADATVNAVVVRSKSAQTSTGSVSINVVVNGVAQTAKSIPASAQTYSDRTWMLASPLGPGTHQIGVRSTNTTTKNKLVNDYLFLMVKRLVWTQIAME